MASNNQRFQNRINATTGNEEAANALSEPFAGIPGMPSADSVFQKTTDAYKEAQWIGETSLSLISLTSSIPTPSGASTVTTNKGIAISNSASGFSIYARRDAAIRAEVARDNWLVANPNARPSVVVGAADIQSTGSVAMTEGPISSTIGPRMQRISNLFGGTGTRTSCGNVIGGCAEQRAASFLERNFRTKPENIMFTQPYRPRQDLFRPVCQNCRTFFNPSQFPNGYGN